MIKGFKIPKVNFRVREGDASDNEEVCAIGGKWIDKSSDEYFKGCLLYTSPSPRDATLSRMPSSA